MSAQKQSPSPIDFLGTMKEAAGVERRLATTGSKALRDVVGRCVSEFNTMVTKKTHKIDSQMKNLILNLLFGLFLMNVFDST